MIVCADMRASALVTGKTLLRDEARSYMTSFVDIRCTCRFFADRACKYNNISVTAAAQLYERACEIYMYIIHVAALFMPSECSERARPREKDEK